SYVSDLAIGSIVGLGSLGYELALQAAARRLQA
ncbi:MAG: 3-dehydroquinate dehydratase, partial [Betaproteobacteria bacterium]|nr:3-dehydroquinate dehydratase [Betaproteobacteria bacterium]